MEAVLARGAQLLLALAGAYAIALWWASIVWTFRDIEARSRNVVTQVVSTLLAVIFPFVGLPLYLILRPKETLDAAFQRSLEEEYLLQDLEELPLCPECHHYVHDDFVLCPHCHARLRDACGACSRLVDLRWALCPYCGAVQHDKHVTTPRVEEPAARWIAPNLRRRRSVPTSVSSDRPASDPAAISAPAEADGAGPAVAAAAARSEPQEDAEPTPFTVVVGAKTLGERIDRLRSYTTSRRPGLGDGDNDRLPAGPDGDPPADKELALPSTSGDGRGTNVERKTPRFARVNGNSSNGGIARPVPGKTTSADGTGTDGSATVGEGGSTEQFERVAVGRRADGD